MGIDVSVVGGGEGVTCEFPRCLGDVFSWEGRKEGRNYTCEFPRCLGDVFSWEGRKEGIILVSSPDAWGMFSRGKEGRKELLVSSPDAWGSFIHG